ncbi:MAG TPA: hypothetical protein VFO70_01010, partial [Chitinophagaceae bacterium]|nr:hypothetical protein [Chitinophagaceae bacterium]
MTVPSPPLWGGFRRGLLTPNPLSKGKGASTSMKEVPRGVDSLLQLLYCNSNFIKERNYNLNDCSK